WRASISEAPCAARASSTCPRPGSETTCWCMSASRLAAWIPTRPSGPTSCSRSWGSSASSRRRSRREVSRRGPRRAGGRPRGGGNRRCRAAAVDIDGGVRRPDPLHREARDRPPPAARDRAGPRPRVPRVRDVCTVMGYREYEPIARHYRAPVVVTGFEPLDLLDGGLRLARQLEAGRARVENQYS